MAPEVRMTEASATQLPRGKNTENRTKELALEENINLLSYIFLIFEITNQMATSMLVADLADEIS